MIEFEELEVGGGDPVQRPRRSPAALLGWCAVLVVVVGLGYAVLGHGAQADMATGPTGSSSTQAGTDTDPDAGTDGGAAPGPSRPHRTVRPGPLEYLALGDVCRVRTDGRTRLSVSFQLTNPSGEQVDVLRVTAGAEGAGRNSSAGAEGAGRNSSAGAEGAGGNTSAGADRPGGLVQRGAAGSGGTCARPGGDDVGGVIRPGRSRLFTLTYRLPDRCSQSSPISVAYRIGVNGQQFKATVPVLASLASVDFTACPARHR